MYQQSTEPPTNPEEQVSRTTEVLRDALLRSLSVNLQRQNFVQLNREKLQRIARNDFPRPRKPPTNKVEQRTTEQHADIPAHKQRAMLELVASLEEKPRRVLNERLNNGDKKLKSVLHMLMCYEEEAIHSKKINADGLSKARNTYRKLLSFWLERFEEFYGQSANSISLLIFYFSASQAQMTQKSFETVAKKFAKSEHFASKIVKTFKAYHKFKHCYKS